MSKFYIIGKISRDLAKRMQSDPNADRGAAIKAICDTVGVKFHSYEWVRGRFNQDASVQPLTPSLTMRRPQLHMFCFPSIMGTSIISPHKRHLCFTSIDMFVILQRV